jgi:NAD(P)-dependent dehydrogenase (short-subunit alcohol dehydrogenase family)
MTGPVHDMSKLPAAAAYPVSRAALNALTVQYAKAVASDHILVNAVVPGGWAADFTEGVPTRHPHRPSGRRNPGPPGHHGRQAAPRAAAKKGRRSAWCKVHSLPGRNASHVSSPGH